MIFSKSRQQRNGYRYRHLVLLVSLLLAVWLLLSCRSIDALRDGIAGKNLIQLEAFGGEKLDLAELSRVQLRGFSVSDFNRKEVRRELNRYRAQSRRTVENLLARADFYLPTIRKIFKEQGIPLDLAYLPLVESGFNPHAKSSANAMGLWQFMYSTGIAYGLRANYWSDERKDVFASTLAAAQHLRYLYKVFDNWPLVLAAYNAGAGRIGRGLKRSGASDFWQLAQSGILKKETVDYVPRFIALATIAKNPTRYGFSVKKVVPMGELKNYTVSDATDIALLAKSAGLSEKKFRSVNPALSQWATPPRRDFEIYIPVKNYPAFDRNFARIPKEERVTFRRYFVSIGDNLTMIAKKFEVPINAVAEINRFASLNDIKAGGVIIIPIKGLEKAKKIADDNGDSKFSSELNRNRSNSRSNKEATAVFLKRYGQTGSGENLPREDAFLYLVKPADSLYVIARRFSVGIRDLMRWNGLQNALSLRQGSLLYIKKR